MMGNIDIATLKQGSSVARDPGGYWCRIDEIDYVKRRMKVKDCNGNCHAYWVSFETLKRRWRK